MTGFESKARSNGTVCSSGSTFGSLALAAATLAASTLAAATLVAATVSAEAMSQRSVAPTPDQIEALLQRAQAETHPRLPPSYWQAELLDFDLKELEPTNAVRWIAIVELAFDFGPPPRSVIGFERERGGAYRLVLDRQDGDFDLKRFAPLEAVRPLSSR